MSEEQQAAANEKYYSYYVETLTQTLNQQVLANVSSLAKAKINGDVLQEWQKENQSLRSQLDESNSTSLQAQQELKNQIEQLKAQALENQSEEINRLKNEIGNKNENIKKLQDEINNLNSVTTDYARIKNQVGQLDGFRSELIKYQKLVQEKDAELKNVVNQKNTELQKLLNEKNGELQKLLEQKNGELQVVITEKDSVINELNSQIEYLKLTPAKRKKLELAPPTEVENVTPAVEETTTIVTDVFSTQEEESKDGGSF